MQAGERNNKNQMVSNLNRQATTPLASHSLARVAA